LREKLLLLNTNFSYMFHPYPFSLSPKNTIKY
jgi:hypothetical protein